MLKAGDVAIHVPACGGGDCRCLLPRLDRVLCFLLCSSGSFRRHLLSFVFVTGSGRGMVHELVHLSPPAAFAGNMGLSCYYLFCFNIMCVVCCCHRRLCRRCQSCTVVVF